MDRAPVFDEGRRSAPVIGLVRGEVAIAARLRPMACAAKKN